MLDRKHISSLFDVTGKTAMITGGTSGIGRMMAEGLTAAGAKTYIVARGEADGQRTAEDLKGLGDCRYIQGDLSSLDGIRAVAAALAEKEVRLDILVNNAGLFSVAAIDEYPEDLWNATIDLNLKSGFFLTQQLLPLLRRAGTAGDPARVVHVGSGHGMRVSSLEAYAYASSKAGLHHLTRVMALRLAPEFITVNALAPGAFPSRITANFSDEMSAAITRGIPRGRYGEAEDIAGALLYLCSRAGAYITATLLPVDGGWAGAG